MLFFKRKDKKSIIKYNNKYLIIKSYINYKWSFDPKRATVFENEEKARKLIEAFLFLFFDKDKIEIIKDIKKAKKEFKKWAKKNGKAEYHFHVDKDGNCKLNKSHPDYYNDIVNTIELLGDEIKRNRKGNKSWVLVKNKSLSGIILKTSENVVDKDQSK